MKRFHHEITNIVNRDNITVIEALSHFCEEKNIDVQDVAQLISPSLKQQMYEEAVKLRMIKDTEIHLDL